MPKISPQTIRNVNEGIVQGVDERIVMPNSVTMALNMVFHKILGRATVRDGTTQLGSQIASGESCLGLFQHITSDGTLVPLSVFDTVLYAFSSSAWASASTGLTALPMRFATFLDTTVAVNGTDSARATTDGTSWATSGTNLDVDNMPAGKYVIEFKDRVYTAGVSGTLDRLFFSSTPTSGAISWTSGNGNIDIEVEEGAGAITGLAKVPGFLLVFKERSLKRWDTNSTFPESLISIGTPSQEAIVQTKQSVFYFNKRGIYETTGGYPRKISRRVQDIIDAIPSSYYASVSGYGDGENVLFSIGDITLNDLTLTNCVLHYRIEEQIWTLLSFPNELLKWSKYVDSNGDEEILAGDDDGNVWRVLKGTGDAGEDINWLLEYQPQEFGSRGRFTDISRMVAYSKKVTNGVLSTKVEEEDFKSYGNINQNVEEIKKSLRGRYISFRIQGKGTEGEVLGIEFPDPNITLSYQE